jgi:hypothetical protein
VLRCTGAYLVLLVATDLNWCWLWRLLESLLHVAYHKYTSMRHCINAMHWVQRVVSYMLMHNLTMVTLTSNLLIHP